jgi:hypothetical protein
MAFAESFNINFPVESKSLDNDTIKISFSIAGFLSEEQAVKKTMVIMKTEIFIAVILHITFCIAEGGGALRGSTVEPVLGTLVNYLGMRRVNTRGLQQANKCMLMAAVAYTLKKLMRWEGKKANTVVKALQKPLQNAFLIITAIIMRYYCLSKVTETDNRNYYLSAC